MEQSRKRGRKPGIPRRQQAVDLPLELWKQFNSYAELADQKKQELISMAVLHMLQHWGLDEIHRNKIRLRAWLEEPTTHCLRVEVERAKDEMAKEARGKVGGRRRAKSSAA